MRSAIAKGTVLALSGLAALLLLEGLLRLTTTADFGSAPPACDGAFISALGLVFDPVFGWRNAVGSRDRRCETRYGAVEMDAAINELGFRGPEIERDKPRGVLRVVCLGNSGTFGIRAFRDESAPEQRTWRAVASYPGRLARRLEQEGFQHVEVINAGVVGYSSSHGLRQLVLRILDLDPDVITVRFGANDAGRSWAPERRSMEPESRIARALLYTFHDWRLLRLALRAYQRVPIFHPAPNSVSWSTRAQFGRNLERIAAVSREHEVRLLLLDYPLGALSPQQERVHRRMPELQADLREFAEQNEIPLLETRPHLWTEDGRFFSEADAVHPNERGATLMADLLFQKLRSLGWLEPGAR